MSRCCCCCGTRIRDVHHVQRRRFAAHGLPRRRDPRVQVEGVPLGLLPDREYEEVVVPGARGRLVVLFSDGVSDHLNPGRRGVRTRAAWRKSCARAATSSPRADGGEDLRRSGSIQHCERFDDQTLIVMKVSADVPLSRQQTLLRRGGSRRHRQSSRHALLRLFARNRSSTPIAPTTMPSATCRT